MDGKPAHDGEGVEFPEWELLHGDDVAADDLGPQLESPMIRPDYFSLPPPPSSNTPLSLSSSTDPSDLDRNFDDSFLANQLFPSSLLHHHPPSSPSSSSSSSTPLSPDSDSKVTLLPHTSAAAAALDSKDEERQEKEIEIERKSDVEEEERRTVWWKVPFEVFKYWVVRVSPVPLSVAAAAAFLGLLILGRRLYKMKRKTQTLKLNVALDDKKVSQLMGRVARLNEAFSVVKRVPIIRPSLPAPSVTLRPVMSMR